MPWYWAQSPQAYTPGRFVSMRSLTTMARSISMPALWAMAVLARTPADTTTSWAGMTSPLPSSTPVTVSPPWMDWICTPVSTRT